MYDGEQGWAYQTAMKILVKLGDLFGATRLIPIESAHISGVSYKTIGDAPIGFLEALVEDGARSKVVSTVNPGGLDYQHLVDVAVPPKVREKQLRIVSLYEKIGIEPALTCTPYYLRKPRRGVHLAWAESSAVIYANSVLGSWTNREGGPSALAAALTGKTPDYGMHRRENRQADIRVKVEAELGNEAEFGALGIHLGKLLEDMVPVFDGLPDHGKAELKQLGAALASSGMTPTFHLHEPCRKEDAQLESLTVEKNALEESFQSLSTSSETPDLIFVGCPHCSLGELRHAAELIKGKKVARDVMFWACASRHVRENAGRYVRAIEHAGGRVVCDTCAVVTWVKELGVDTLMTNSAKTAYYAPTLNKVKVRFAPLTECINTACRQ